MYSKISSGSVAASKAEAMAVFAFAPVGGEEPSLGPGLGELDRSLDGVLGEAAGRAEWNAGRGAATWLYPGQGAKRVAVVGLGDRSLFRSETLRTAAAALVNAAEAAGVAKLRIETGGLLSGLLDDAEVGRAIGEGLGIGNFKFESFKGSAPNGRRTTKAGSLTVDVGDAGMREGLARGLGVAESVNVARRIAATPPNVANPAWLAAECKRIAKAVGLRCTVIEAAEAEALGMGGLLAVGAAGSTPPRLIVLEHRPPRMKKNIAPSVLIGKAVTFDTGGYNIKPGDSMASMKYDKCGGAAVLGALHAAATLGLPTPVVGIIPTAENMIGHAAYRASDILTMSNGVTVEVTNTDAEGRLILADALVYACRRFKPAAVIDLATLTGGAVVGLGRYCAALFANDAGLMQEVLDAGDASGERAWAMPLWPEHREAIKATHGDIVNSAGREASPIQGAAFLSYFVGPEGKSVPLAGNPVRWAHLDIAGPADVDKDRDFSGLFPKGPTGFGVRLLVRWMERE